MKVKQPTNRFPPLVLKVANEADTTAELKDMVNILYYLRKSTIQWQIVYGSQAREIKERWEKKADEFITNHISIDYEK
jgi:hypothetical protein